MTAKTPPYAKSDNDVDGDLEVAPLRNILQRAVFGTVRDVLNIVIDVRERERESKRESEFELKEFTTYASFGRIKYQVRE